MGRPTRLTDDTSKAIIDATLAGVHVEIACQMAGIARSTYFLWKVKGQKDAEARDEGDFPAIDASHTHEWSTQGVGPEKQDSMFCWCGHTRYSDFVARLLVGEARAEARISAKIQGAFDQDPRLALYFMERRWPARWARRDRLAVTTEMFEQSPSTVTEDTLVERLSQTMAILEKAGRLPNTTD